MERKLRVLVACEESQAVCKAFRALGHEAYSCDLQDCSGGHPGWHFKEDIFEVIKREPKFDLMIAHPPCTDIAVSGAAHFAKKIADGRQQAAIDFFMNIANADIKYIAIENPVCIMSTKWRKPNQIIHPFQFGENSTKTTCLWTKNLPKLNHTKIITPEKYVSKSGKVYDKWWFDTCLISDLKLRAKARSKTFQGIANAMASQWSEYILANENN